MIMVNKYLNKLQGKRVLVVGGSSGLGFSVAESCIEHGAVVFIASSTKAKVDRACNRLVSAYPDAQERIKGFQLDLAGADVEQQIENLLQFATKKGQEKLDHVVETSGDALLLVPLSETTVETVSTASRVRLIGPLMLAKHLIPYINATPESSFTLTSGATCQRPDPGWTIPTIVGSAKEGLTRSLAKELRPLRVNCVSPYVVQTELFEGLSQSTGVPMDQLLAPFKQKNLTNTVAVAEDLAESYLYLMKNPYVTGIVTHADGGFLQL